MTLGCLQAYRRLGVGSKLLSHVLELAKKENVNNVTLHVQVGLIKRSPNHILTAKSSDFKSAGH